MTRHRPLLAAALVLLGACGSDEAGDRITAGEVPSRAAIDAEWQRVPDAPLSARSTVVGVWTGDEVLLVGGSVDLCPPGASCSLPPSGLTDGAAYDPATSTWRTIAPAPMPIEWPSTAVVLGNDVYFWLRLAEPHLLRYSVSEDGWADLPVPPGMGSAHDVVAVGDRLLAYVTSQEAGSIPDLLVDPSDGSAIPIPTDPLAPSPGRTIVVARGDPYLFAHPLVPNPGSEPSLVLAARFVQATGAWERLADSDIVGEGQLVAVDGRIVYPMLGGADGGQVNNWGRAVPYGGEYVIADDTWRDLPPAPSESLAMGVLGSTSASYAGAGPGLVLDLPTDQWVAMPAVPADEDSDQVTIRRPISAGTAAFVFGGARFGVGAAGGELLGDAWIWQPRSVADAPPTSTSSTSTSTSTTAAADPCDGTDLSGEPPYSASYLERWTDANGCDVRLDVLMTRRPGPDFHCEGWPPDLVMGTPLGARTGDSETRIYVRDPDGYFGDPALQAGFATLPEPPVGTFDTGYRQDDVALWVDPDDDAFVYIVAAGGIERWPRMTNLVGCA